MMASLIDLIWHNGKLFGQELTFWAVVGWMGQAVFASRFAVQWYVTEKKKEVVVPVAFWWLSLTGCFLLLVYALKRHDPVIAFGFIASWIPYMRNLVIHYRHIKENTNCERCSTLLPRTANFCPKCGAPVTKETVQSSQ